MFRSVTNALLLLPLAVHIMAATGVVLAFVAGMVILRSRHERTWTLVLDVFAHIVLGTAVTAFGAALQIVAWSAFNQGATAGTQVLLTALEWIPLIVGAVTGTFAGALGGVAAAVGRSVLQKVLYSVIATIAGFIVSDIVVFATTPDVPMPGWIPFSLLSNVLGGALAGTLIGGVSWLAGHRALVPAAIRQRPVTSLVVLLLTVSIVPLFYFVFVYHFPQQVRFELEDWTAIRFEYLAPYLHQEGRPGVSRLTLLGTVVEVALGTSTSTIALEWLGSLNAQRPTGSSQREITIASVSPRRFVQLTRQEAARGRRIASLLRAAEVKYRGRVGEGTLEITGEDLAIGLRVDRLFESPPDRAATGAEIESVRADLEFERGRVIQLWQLQSFLTPEVQRRWFPEKAGTSVDLKALNLAGMVGGRLKLQAEGPLVVWVRPLRKGDPAEEVVIQLPGGATVKAPARYGNPGAGEDDASSIVLLVVEGAGPGTGVRAEVPLGDNPSVLCVRCWTTFAGWDGYQAVVGKVLIHGARGHLEMDGSPREIGGRDVSLGTGSMSIEDLVSGRLLMEGQSQHVGVGGVVLTRTLWEGVSTAERVGLLAGCATLVLAIRKLMRRRNVSTS
jgi:hypothetical protein